MTVFRYSHFLYPASVMRMTLGSSLSSGQVAGVVCTLLALAAAGLPAAACARARRQQ